MEMRTDFSLCAYNTFHVEAAAATYVRFDSDDEIVDFLSRNELDGHRRLVLGGGSNLLFVDDFDGIVLHPLLKGIDVIEADRRHVWIRAMAGENWDDLVAFAVSNGWAGIENLSLIPGSVGASAVQNIGAYGVEVKDVIDRVEGDFHRPTVSRSVFLPTTVASDTGPATLKVTGPDGSSSRRWSSNSAGSLTLFSIIPASKRL